MDASLKSYVQQRLAYWQQKAQDNATCGRHTEQRVGLCSCQICADAGKMRPALFLRTGGKEEALLLRTDVVTQRKHATSHGSGSRSHFVPAATLMTMASNFLIGKGDLDGNPCSNAGGPCSVTFEQLHTSST